MPVSWAVRLKSHGLVRQNGALQRNLWVSCLIGLEIGVIAPLLRPLRTSYFHYISMGYEGQGRTGALFQVSPSIVTSQRLKVLCYNIQKVINLETDPSLPHRPFFNIKLTFIAIVGESQKSAPVRPCFLRFGLLLRLGLDTYGRNSGALTPICPFTSQCDQPSLFVQSRFI